MKKLVAQALACVFLLTGQPSFAYEADVHFCFTQRGVNCEAQIVSFINEAEKSLLVQAYSLTSEPIVLALVSAHEHGVEVRVIMDKSQLGSSRASAETLAAAGIPVSIDHGKGRGIAHNKLMIEDGKRAIGGSYNYSKNANQNNVENVVFFDSPRVAQELTDNFILRLALSIPFKAE